MAEKVYKIQESKIIQYNVKQALLGTRDMVYSVLIIFLALFIFSGFKLPTTLFLFFLPYIFIFLGVTFLLNLFKIGTYEATRFIFDENSINRFQIEKEIDVVSQFFLRRVEAKTGQTRNQFIPFINIDKIKLTNNEITIKSNDYNFMNANGMIKIPCETENYNEIIETIKSIIADHKGIKGSDKIRK